MSSLIGKQIDNYKIIEKIGHGGMGVVYRAEDTALERSVAMKRIDPLRAEDPRFLRRFQDEAKTSAKLEHRNIVKINEWVQDREHGVFIVMEYVDGYTLAEYLVKNGPMPYRQALPIFKRLLGAIGYAHRKNVIHRDIKPGNVMLTKDGTAKLLDFGLAKIQRDDNSTRTMHSLGTLQYMSPEQIESPQSLDSRTDIYSLGMTLYEMLTGQTPFKDPSSEHSTGGYGMMKYIVEKKFQPPKHFNPEIPEPVNKLVMKAVEKKADKRFQNADEMLLAISEVEKAERRIPQPEASPKSDILNNLVALVNGFSNKISIAFNKIAQYSKTFINGIRTKAQEFQTTSLFDKLVRYKQYVFLGFVAVIAVVAILLISGSPRQTAPIAEPNHETGGENPTEPLAFVSIVVTPENAQVSIDEKQYDSSQLTDLQLDPGKHSIDISLAGYEPINEQFELQESTNKPIPYNLDPLPATVSILVNPTTANLTVNGNFILRSNHNNLKLPPGTYDIVVSQNEYQTRRDQLQLEPGKTYSKEYRLRRIGVAVAPHRRSKLQVTTEPLGASVWLDGEFKGTTNNPLLIEGLKIGNRRIKIEKRGYQTVSRTVPISHQEINYFFVRLLKKVKIKLLAQDLTGRFIIGTIYVNNVNLQRSTPLEVDIAIGVRYVIEVKRRGYISDRKEVYLERGTEIPNNRLIFVLRERS